MKVRTMRLLGLTFLIAMVVGFMGADAHAGTRLSRAMGATAGGFETTTSRTFDHASGSGFMNKRPLASIGRGQGQFRRCVNCKKGRGLVQVNQVPLSRGELGIPPAGNWHYGHNPMQLDIAKR